MPIRLLLAEDHVMVRQGLRVLLEQAGMVVIGEASDGPEALRLAHTHAAGGGHPGYRHAALEWPRDGQTAAGGHAPDQDHRADYAHGRAIRLRGPAGRGGRLCLEDAGGGGHRAGHPHRSPGRDLFESAGHECGCAGLFDRRRPCRRTR